MGTIVPRKRADGSTAYLARIRIKQDRKVVYSESKTFDKRHRAETWAEDREKALAKPGALELAMGIDPTFGAVIQGYVNGLRKEPGRTKKQVLNAALSEAAQSPYRSSSPIGGILGGSPEAQGCS